MKDIRVAVWGLGPHAIRNILPALASCPGIVLLGVCSRNSEVVSGVRNAFQCTSWGHPGEMLADPRVDAVYVSTPIALHAAHGALVLRAGKHLWCDKPLAETSAQVANLVALSCEQGVTLAEGFMYLYHAQFAYLQQTLTSGRLGIVHSITCRFGIPTLANPGFRTDPAMGGGAFLDVGSYPISVIVSLYPNADPEVLFSEIITAKGSLVDTGGRALLRYNGEMCAMLDWHTGCAYRNEIDFWGTEGSVSCKRAFSKSADYVPCFRVLDRYGRESQEVGRAENHFVGMFMAFRSLIDDRVLADRERLLIMQRGRLIDRIGAHSRPKESSYGQVEKRDAG